MKAITIPVSVAIAFTLMCLLSTPARANYYAGRESGDVGFPKASLVAELHSIYPWVQKDKSAVRPARPIMLAYCGAMGGYASFEAQARAQARMRSRPQAPVPVSPRMTQQAQVKSDQTSLKNLGYYNGSLDGLNGPGTHAAVRDFQRANGLPVNGTLDSSTRSLLTIGNPKSKPASTGAQTSDQQQIMADQKALQQHGYYTGPLDGKSGSATRAAIAEFRDAHDLGYGATLDAKTREVLSGANVRQKADWAASKSRKAVSEDQQALADLGYYTGPIDGVRGQNTLAADRQFRKDNSLSAADAPAALRKAQADVVWLRNVDGDGVSLIRIVRHQDGYLLRTGNGDRAYQAGGAGQVRIFIDGMLKSLKVQKVYVDVSSLTAKELKSFKDTLDLRSSSQTQLLENSNTRDLLFSRSVNLTDTSPPIQMPTGFWRSTIKLSSTTPVRYVLHIIGKTKELTATFVQRLLHVHSGSSASQSILSRSLLRVRKELNVTEEEIREEFSETIELMSIPRSSSVRDT